MSISRHATAYAERLGWHIFLVGEDCRKPIKHGEEGQSGAWVHGVKDASADPVVIAERLRLYPRANIALACGRASGVLALDIDAKGEKDGFAELAKLEAEFEPLPLTWRQRTPSGGAHILFRYPTGVDPANRVDIKRYWPDGSRTVYAGLDVRGEGASIALTPSRKPTGVYSWDVPPKGSPAPVPRWMLALMLSEPPPPPKRPPLKFDSYDRAARYCTKAVDDECGALARMGAGSGRNQALFVAACRLGELVAGNLMPQDAAEDALERAAHDCGLVREDGVLGVRATIKSGLRKGLLKPRELRL